MQISFTEVGGTALSISASDAWTSYDILANNGIPARAIVYIVAANLADAANNIMGLRTSGSSLARYLKMTEAEDGGANLIGWYVQVGADGKIEYYTGDHTDTAFYIMGYWMGLTYQEYFAELSLTTSGGTYADNHVSLSSYSPAAGRVCTFALCNNRATTKMSAGVRCGDAIYNKTTQLHEAESGGVTGQMFVTKTDASNQVEYYVESTTYVDVYITGVFDANMGYMDRYRGDCAASITSANTWTDMDCTSYIGKDGQVVDCVCNHNLVSGEVNLGVRMKGSSAARYLSAMEAEDNGYCGFTCPTKTDANGVIQFYSGNASYEICGIDGYYIPGTIKEYDKSTTDAVDLSESITITKSIKVSETIGLAEAVILTKSIIVTDSIGLADATALSKSMLVTDSIGAADSVGPWSKALLTADTISLADVSQLVKALIVSDGITLTDAAILIKELYVSDGIALADAITRTIIGGLTEIVVTDNIGLSDSVVLGKSMLTADTLTLTDAVKLSKVLILTDDIALSDTAKLLKSILVADTISLADAVALVKSITVADGITLTDAATRGSAITVLLNLIAIRGRRDKESLLGRKDGETLTGRKDSETSNNRG